MLTNKRDISCVFQYASFSFTDVFILTDGSPEEYLKSALQQSYFWKGLGEADHVIVW